ncbi:MAG: V-type ATPase subunit [Chloroflexi bacterium]|nr:V-type ATPase subunit [Chloroflexota bacterium]
MAASGVSGYAAISARVRAMYSSLLSPQEMARLSDSPDFQSLLAQLKPTIYGSYIEELKEKELTPRRVVFQIKGRLADVYDSVIHMAPEHTRPLLTQLYRYFEVENLKAVLRGIVTDPTWERVRDVLFPYGSMSVLPLQAMVEAGNVSAAVELLRGTVYEETLSFAMKRYSAEQNLFPLEVALDLNYWRKLWQETKRLPSKDQQQALRVVGSLIDMNNLMWAIRYRVYHELSEEELINYTLPFGYHLRDDDIRSIAAGADIASVVQRVYPGIPDLNILLEEPRSGLPLLELQLKQNLMRQCMAAFVGDPFHIGIPLAYLVLCELEIQDMTVLLEAMFSRVSEEKYRPYLLKTALVKA